jgi:hypothetical protein
MRSGLLKPIIKAVYGDPSCCILLSGSIFTYLSSVVCVADSHLNCLVAIQTPSLPAAPDNPLLIQ